MSVLPVKSLTKPLAALTWLVLSNPSQALGLDEQMTNAFHALCGEKAGYQETLERARGLGWENAPERFNGLIPDDIVKTTVFDATRFASGNADTGYVFAYVGSIKRAGLQPNKRSTMCYIRAFHSPDIIPFDTLVSQMDREPKLTTSQTGGRVARWVRVWAESVTMAFEEPRSETLTLSMFVQIWGDTGK